MREMESTPTPDADGVKMTADSITKIREKYFELLNNHGKALNEIGRLVALQKYCNPPRHIMGCAATVNPGIINGGKCTCGLDNLLKP